jgi:hypothetical protein
MLDKFVHHDGPKKIFIYYQVPDLANGEEVKDSNADPIFFITDGETERIKDKAVWFMRNLTEGRKEINITEHNDD